MGKTKDVKKSKITDRVRSGSHSLNPGKSRDLIRLLIEEIKTLINSNYKKIERKLEKVEMETTCEQRRQSIAFECTRTSRQFATERAK